MVRRRSGCWRRWPDAALSRLARAIKEEREGSPQAGKFGGAAVVGQPAAGARAMLAADTSSEQDFRKIINLAKAKVFPAVVFIRVVQQNFAAGERATEEVAGSGVIISGTGGGTDQLARR